MKNNTLAIVLGCLGFAVAAQAAPITFNFQENGHNLNLGSSSIFTQNGYTLTASGFTTTGAASDLFAKYTSGNLTETGLGMVRDAGLDHEIDTAHFIQLSLPTSPQSTISSIIAGSVQSGETAHLYWTTTPGSLLGAISLGSHTGNGVWTFNIPSSDQAGYLDITADRGDVVLESATITPQSVPDGGTTATLLGAGLAGLGLLRRKLS